MPSSVCKKSIMPTQRARTYAIRYTQASKQATPSKHPTPTKPRSSTNNTKPPGQNILPTHENRSRKVPSTLNRARTANKQRPLFLCPSHDSSSQNQLPHTQTRKEPNYHCPAPANQQNLPSSNQTHRRGLNKKPQPLP